MLLLLALLGCNPGPADISSPDLGTGPEATQAPQGHRIVTSLANLSIPERSAPPTPKMPAGQAVYTDCGAGPWPPSRNTATLETDEEAPPPPTYKPRPRPRPVAQPAPSPAPAPPASTASPGLIGGATGEGRVGSGGLGNQGIGYGGGGAKGDAAAAVDGSVASGPAAATGAPKRQKKKAEEAKPTARPEAEPAADAPDGYMAVPDDIFDNGNVAAAPSGGETAGAPAKNLDKLGYVAPEEPSRTRRGAEKEAHDRRASDGDAIAEAEPVEEEMTERANQWMDWGATVHLSNDDSMSLASAQRVLWSVMNGRRPQVSEIRPHELLNYFSFDTAPVAEDEMFSVFGAAEAQDDTLSVALAVQGGTPPRQPLDLTLLVDTSGSMAADGRMAYTRRGLETMIDRLHPGDRLDLVTFESRTCTTLTDFVVGRDDPALLRHAMGALTPKGSTDLNAGLQEAYRIQTGRTAEETHRRNRRVMLITDAFLNSGKVDPDVVSEIGAAYEDNGVRLTGIGVGRDFNDEVLDKLTEKGKGAYVYLGSEAVVDRVFGAGFDSLVRTIAHDVRFSLELPDSLAMERFYGEEASTDAADIQPIHYYAGTSQVFLQDLKIRGGELVMSDPVTMRIEWRDATSGEPDALELQTTVGALVDGEVRNLHKAQALMAWSDWVQSWAMRGDACGASRITWSKKAEQVGDDAELAFLEQQTTKICGPVPEIPDPVSYKVKVDSDVPIGSVALSCPGMRWTQQIGGGDTVARFDEATPGRCTVTLNGQVPMSTSVSVPETGGDLRCLVRGGRLSCS